MSSKITPRTTGNGRVCPVCGKSTYSRGGIHPQCAILKADMPRQEQLAEERKKAAPKSNAKTRGAAWLRKCPKCGTEVHVRLKMCKCGKALM